MTRRDKIEIGDRYHVYNRGVEKRDVFMDDRDYQRFLKRLRACAAIQPPRLKALNLGGLTIPGGFQPISQFVSIEAYCLMPNHFHLLLTPLVEDGISLFLSRLQNGYTKYLNCKYNRVGPLFQGAYKITPMESQAHYDYIIPYIHLNALDLSFPEWREGRVRNVELAMKQVSEYPWSDYKRHKTPEYDAILREIMTSEIDCV